jgi:hypothetical protein
VVAHEAGQGETRLQPMTGGSNRQGQTQCTLMHEYGIHIPKVGPGLGQLGRLEWASCWKRKREGKGKWAARVLAQNSLGKKSISNFKMLSKFSTQFEFESNSNYE